MVDTDTYNYGRLCRRNVKDVVQKDFKSSFVKEEEAIPAFSVITENRIGRKIAGSDFNAFNTSDHLEFISGCLITNTKAFLVTKVLRDVKRNFMD